MKLGDKEKAWVKAALSRAVRTMCQVMLTYLTLGAVVHDINWREMVSAGVVGACYSILTSVVNKPPESKDIADGGVIELSNPMFEGDTAHVSFQLNKNIEEFENGASITFKCIDNMDDEHKKLFRGASTIDFEKEDEEKE